MTERKIDELNWLLENPQFKERPASLEEFLGPNYLNIEQTVRVEIRKVLSEVFGEEVQVANPSKYMRAFMTGAIGIGKTTVASISLCYLVHWCLCLKDPQEFFGLMPGSRIAFMMMSTSAPQAKDVIFGDVRERIKLSPWFSRFPYLGPGGTLKGSTQVKNRFEWPEAGIVIIPLGSEDTAAEGYNVLGGVIDEVDSGKITERKIYMQAALDAIENRIRSRFGKRGLIFLIGQMKSQLGFAAGLYAEYMDRGDAYAKSLTIWEAKGYDHEDYRDEETDEFPVFYYDTLRKEMIPSRVIDAGFVDPDQDHILKVPEFYRADFERNPEKALRDLAGIPPAVDDPFISHTHRIYECRDRWIEEFGDESPVTEDGVVADWFKAEDSIPRVVHIDMGYASGGDACGIAMGHVRRVIEVDGELKPYIVLDYLHQVRALAGHDILFSDIRQIVYDLRDIYGFTIKRVTMDGFQSQDTMQQFQQRRIHADYLSVDKEKLPYFDVREAIYEERIAFPPYMVRMPGDETKRLEILVSELSQLTDTGRKIDHSATSSKDLADAVAGVTHSLLGDRRLRNNRNVSSLSDYRQQRISGDSTLHPAYRGNHVHSPSAPTGLNATPRGVTGL